MHTRILVVDDDRKVTDLLHRGLGYEGYIIDIAVAPLKAWLWHENTRLKVWGLLRG